MQSIVAFIALLPEILKALPTIVELMKSLVSFCENKIEIQETINNLRLFNDAMKKAQQSTATGGNTSPTGNTSALEGFFHSGGKPQ
mgnify:CR=1 FL=1